VGGEKVYGEGRGGEEEEGGEREVVGRRCNGGMEGVEWKKGEGGGKMRRDVIQVAREVGGIVE